MRLTTVIALDNGVNHGKFVCTVQDEEGLTGGPFTGYVGILTPDGDVVANILTPSGGTFPSAGSVTSTYDIPLDADGNFISGEYTLSFKVLNAALADVGSRTAVYDFQPLIGTGGGLSNLSDPNSLVLSAIVDCRLNEITLDDTIDNTGWTVSETLFSVTVPPTATNPNPSASTTTVANPYVYGFSTNGSYLVGVRVTRTKTEQITAGIGYDIVITNNEQLIVYQYISVNCALYCQAYDAMKCSVSALDSSGCGNWDNASVVDINRHMKVISDFTLALAARECGDLVGEMLYLNRVKDGCDCGCTDC